MKRELRLGNLVTQKGSDFVEEVTLESLNRKDVVLSPIPLTEEWLLKFGFKKVECEENTFSSQYYNEILHLITGITEEKGIFIVSKMTEDAFCVLNSIKYVHQLQNLYFALTGEELEINK